MKRNCREPRFLFIFLFLFLFLEFCPLSSGLCNPPGPGS